MKIAGIIAEFNPFHNGHKYIIDKAKEITGADTIICIVSGPFTQKGNISIQDKFEKARVAINNGCDLVIELPCIISTSSASYFASGAVKILDNLNIVDYLCFGSETPDITILKKIANIEITNEEKIWSEISLELKKGISFAMARNNVLKKYLNEDEIQALSYPNNILGIEYIKALIKQKSNIMPIAIQRVKMNDITSATRIREKILNNCLDYTKYIPNDSNLVNLSNEDLFKILKYEIISKGKEYIKNISEVTEGLENKIYNEINNSKTYDEYIQNIKSKRYELSKIKRIMIHILLDITKEDFEELNKSNYYAHILAISKEKKNELLSLLSQKSKIKAFPSFNDKVFDSLDKMSQKSILLDLKVQNIYSSISNLNINRDYTNMI